MNLDPESEQIREVYAYYGLAMYWAQCVEQSIFQQLLFFDHFPKAIASYTSSEKWVAEFDSYETRELGQTMGKLIRRLQEVGLPNEDITNVLAEVLQLRNWLAHSYFSDRALEFTTTKGREEMLEELDGVRDKLQKCAINLDSVSLPAAQSLGFTEEMRQKVTQEMIAAYAKQTKY